MMTSFKLVLICMSLMVVACTGKTKKSMTPKSAKAHRMVGGEEVNVTQVPFIVSIKNVPFDYHKCAGFLVSDRHVVTTATCLYPSSHGQAQVYLYPTTLDNLDESYEISDWVIHYNFSVLPHENDIAVATLKTPVRDARYPDLSKWASLPKGSEVTTYGWGYSKVEKDRYGNFTMHSKSLKVMSNAMCSLLLHEYLSCETICASSDAQFASAPADVGTPLIFKHDSTEFVVGMLTKATNRLVSAATFVSIYEYRGFIEDVMKGTKPGSPEAPTSPPTTTEPGATLPGGDGPEDVDDEDEENYSGDSEDDDEPVRGRRRKNSRHHDNGMSRFGKYRLGN